MKLLIFGCGRTGAALARQMSSRGHDVTMVEQDARALDRLVGAPGVRTIVGDGLSETVLETAGIRETDAFITATRGDNTNLMAAQIAQKRYGVAKVCAKVNDPQRAAEYKKLGVMCITPNLLTAGMMRNWLLDEPYAPVDEFNDLDEEGAL
jgi:trk system potassium uptake protein TrkA